MTPLEVADIIERFVDNKTGDWEWDDFISVPIADLNLDKIRKRCATLDKEYPPTEGKSFCSADGVEVLRNYVHQLRGA